MIIFSREIPYLFPSWSAGGASAARAGVADTDAAAQAVKLQSSEAAVASPCPVKVCPAAPPAAAGPACATCPAAEPCPSCPVAEACPSVPGPCPSAAAQPPAAALPCANTSASGTHPSFSVSLLRTLVGSMHGTLNSIAQADSNGMGNTGDVMEQTDKLFKAVASAVPSARTFCEVGTNVGHGAALFLVATGARHFHSFDCGGKKSVMQGFEALQVAMPDLIAKQHIGNSVKVVPEFTLENRDFECDVIHIDGAHDGPFPAADFANARRLARADGRTLVVFDDCNCDTEWCIAPLDVFNQGVADGHIRPLETQHNPDGPKINIEGRKKGSCLGWMLVRDQSPVPLPIPTHIIDKRFNNTLVVKCD